MVIYAYILTLSYTTFAFVLIQGLYFSVCQIRGHVFEVTLYLHCNERVMIFGLLLHRSTTEVDGIYFGILFNELCQYYTV